jgi:hypothetical protein
METCTAACITAPSDLRCRSDTQYQLETYVMHWHLHALETCMAADVGLIASAHSNSHNDDQPATIYSRSDD